MSKTDYYNELFIEYAYPRHVSSFYLITSVLTGNEYSVKMFSLLPIHFESYSFCKRELKWKKSYICESSRVLTLYTDFWSWKSLWMVLQYNPKN